MLGGCGKKKEPSYVERTGFFFDTVCQIRVFETKDGTEEAAKTAIDHAFSLCQELEDLLSAHKSGSDVDRVNKAGGAAVTCDPRTVEVIQMALAYGDLSDGAFDITIGAAQDLWDFRGEGDPYVPDADALALAVSNVDYRQVVVDGLSVSLKDPDARIDLGGIGKGYISDQVATMFSEEGVTSALINFGGNITCLGDKGGEPFNIGIEKPFSEKAELSQTLDVTDGTVVTSGIYERCFELDGQFYHHILDPETGYPAATDVVGVTVTSSLGHSADCDALATICLLLGKEKGAALVDSLEGYKVYYSG